jgi:ADP-heptose:LPS heptosyltransferase
MKTCFISRFGGSGDILHAAHLPELIKKHYKVDHITFETGYNGMHILSQNPFIDNLQFIQEVDISSNRLKKNWEYMEETHDLFFNLINTIELAYCCQEFDQRFYRSDKWRRENLGKMSYYDVMTKAAGLPESYYGTRGMLYFDDSEHDDARKWVKNRKEAMGVEKLILVNLSGSSLHKKFVQAESVCRKILGIYPEAAIIITGDEHCKSQEFEHERVISWVAKRNFRTVALMTKYVDLTLSLESGIPLVAHSWDAPCLHLLTAASPDNHCKYAKNAYWIQAHVPCSPCHKNPREYFGCPVREKMPACVWFDEDLIMEKIGGVIG